MIDRTGQQLGNYRLIRLLGQGGFADVYLGEHIHLKTQAAIKVLQMRLANDDMKGFLTEAQTIAHLDHPHIVRVLDFGVEHNMPFLVMAYAPNGTLRQRHPKGVPVQPALIVAYVKQMASALQYAHNQNLIHRDVKPENMLLDRNNNLLLSDFGIAVVSQSSRYQSTKDSVGTVAYMAPEQLQGKPLPASDQYALAISVYEWLTGDRPFQGSFWELFSQHMAVSPPPIRARYPEITPHIEQVVLTALAKDPQQRFINIEAFANALTQSYEPTQLQADALTYRKDPQIAPPPPGMPQPATPPAYFPPPASQPLRPPAGSGLQQNLATPQNTPSGFQQGLVTPQNTPSGNIPSQTFPAGTPAWNMQDQMASGIPSGNIPGQIIPPVPAKKRSPSRLVAIVSAIVAVAVIASALSFYVFNLNKGSGSPQTGTSGTHATATATATPTATTAAGTTPTADATMTAASAVTPTPTSGTPPQAGTLLYQADWSKGLNDWNGSSEWKAINNGTIGSDGSSDGNNGNGYLIWAAFKPSTANYAVEVQVQYIRSANAYGEYEFGVIVRGDGNNNGYEVGIADGCDTSKVEALIRLVQNDPGDSCVRLNASNVLTGKDYQLDTTVHTYRVEVTGNNLKLSLDGHAILQTSDNTYVSAGQVGLRDMYADINVLSYKVYAL